MLFNTNYLGLILCICTLSDALPLDGASNLRGLAPRAKSYSIVNVDGGSTSTPPPGATTVVGGKTKTKTVQVTAAVPTVTDIVTTTVVDPSPTAAPTISSSTSSISAPTSTPISTLRNSVSTPSSTSQPPPTSEKPTETAKPSIVTVIITTPATVVVTASAKSTEYYDNGLWHTSYVVKSFGVPGAPTPSPRGSLRL